jgi:hypothetical protein
MKDATLTSLIFLIVACPSDNLSRQLRNNSYYIVTVAFILDVVGRIMDL